MAAGQRNGKGKKATTGRGRLRNVPAKRGGPKGGRALESASNAVKTLSDVGAGMRQKTA